MTTRLGTRIAKLEQSTFPRRIRYLLRDDEQPNANEIARGQKFVRAPGICANSEEWLKRFAPNG